MKVKTAHHSRGKFVPRGNPEMEEIDIHTILQISRFKKVELTGPPRIGTDATRKVLNLGKFGIAKVPSCRHGLPSLRRLPGLESQSI